MNMNKSVSAWLQPEVVITLVILAVAVTVCVAFQYLSLNKTVSVPAHAAMQTAATQHESTTVILLRHAVQLY